MSTPTQNQVHIDVPLTNISLAYTNDTYIAEQVFAVVPVEKQSNKYWTYDKDDWFRNNVARRGPGSRAERADYGISTGNYLCEVYALAKGVPDEVEMNADAQMNVLSDTTEWLTDQVLLNKEIQVASVAFGAGWSSSATPSTLWDVDTSNPIGDVTTAVKNVEQAIGRIPTNAVVGGDLWASIKQHPDLIDRIKGAAVPGNPAILNVGAVAALFELETLLIGRAMKDTSLEGQAESRSRIWGLHMLVYYKRGSASLRTPNSAYTLTWGARQTNRYREDQEHQDVVEVQEAFDVKQVAADAGYLIKSAASA